MRSNFVAAVFAACLLAGAASAETIQFKITLDGLSEHPSVKTDAKGSATVQLDTVSKTLSYTVDYSGLSGPATMAHIHGPAAPGSDAGVVVPLTASPSPLKGVVTLTDAQIADLLAGKDYINIHTAAHPTGEIRGYLIR